jgi:putative Ca2+/H+ antiporter (TMEM165/GDT1 family)
MDLKIFFATFTAVFFAELADKTQLVGMTMSAKSGKPVSVWLGSVTAYIIITAITVLIGTGLGKYMKPDIVKYLAASLFIIIGISMFLGKI